MASYLRIIRNHLVIVFISFLVFQLSSLTVQSPPKLILVQQFIRHGNKYPSLNAQFIKNDQPLNLAGYLTNDGARMSYLLGKQLFNVYWQDLFGQSKQLHKQKFRIRNAKYNRTIETGQALVLGLLENAIQAQISAKNVKNTIPPFKNIQQKSKIGPIFGRQNKKTHFIPMYTVQYLYSNTSSGDFLVMHPYQACPMQQTWSMQNLEGQTYRYIFESPEYLATVKQIQEAFNVTVTGDKDSLSRFYAQIEDFKGLGDTLPPFCYQSSPDFNRLKIYSAIVFYIFHYGQQFQLHNQMTGMFAEVIHNIKQKALNQQYPSWFIYTTHGIEIGGFLAILDLMSIECMMETYSSGQESSDCEVQMPVACSNFIFETYHYATSDRFTFKIRYNGEYRKIRFCNDKYECDVDSLYQWFQTWKVENVIQTCMKQQ